MATREKPQMSFPSTARRWFDLTRTEIETEDEGEALEALDRLLLCHAPTSDLETLVLMEVIAETIRGGGRVDGLDVAAVLGIRDRLLRESTEAGLGASFAALQPLARENPVLQRFSATG